MEYRKEQSFIVAYDDDNNMRGKWNILTNEYIGVRGNPIKSTPVAFKLGNEIMPNYIENALRLLNNYNSRYYHFTEKKGQRLEQLISLQLVVDEGYSAWNFLETDTTKLTKDLVNFLVENCEGIYNEQNIKHYNFYKKHLGFINKCGEHKDWAIAVYQGLEDNKKIPNDFIEGMIIRAIHEKVFTTYAYYAFSDVIVKWYDMIQELGDTLEVKHNILTNYVILKYLYDEYRVAHYDEKLKEKNDLNWLYYENSNYIVRPLISRKDFHLEAEAQHNCVERMYMERVFSGLTHVVVVRKKANPDKSYITCEVTNDGQIWQYLYRNNNWVDRRDDLEFREEYLAHIQSSLKE